MNTPLGRYSELAAFLLACGIVAAALVGHLLNVAADMTFLDAAAFLAIGAVFGKQSAANGYAAVAVAAHARLDAIGAPPSGELVGPGATVVA